MLVVHSDNENILLVSKSKREKDTIHNIVKKLPEDGRPSDKEFDPCMKWHVLSLLGQYQQLSGVPQYSDKDHPQKE